MLRPIFFRPNVSLDIKVFLYTLKVLLKSVYFYFYQPHSGAIKEVFTFGSDQKEPVMIRVSHSMALLQHGTKSLFVNHHGKIAKDAVITWTGIPKKLGTD